MSYYRSAFPANAGQYSFFNALIVAGGGTLSAVGGGIVADRITSSSAASSSAGPSKAAPHRAALIPMLGSLAAIPFWICAVRSGTFGVAMASLLIAYLLAECWYGATFRAERF